MLKSCQNVPCMTFMQISTAITKKHNFRSVDVVRHKLLCKMVGEDKKLTSKSKVDLALLPPCTCALRPYSAFAYTNVHTIRLYRSHNFVMRDRDGLWLQQVCWSDCGLMVLFCLTHLLTFWLPLMKIMQSNRTKMTNLILKISLKVRVAMNREYDRAWWPFASFARL